MDAVNAEQCVKVFVGNIPRALSEDEISPVFKEYGNIIEIHILRDKQTGQKKGSAFVKYASMEDAQRCIDALDGTAAFPEHDDKFIEVRLAGGKESRSDHRIYVGKLPISATSDELREVFSEFGPIVDINVKRRSGAGNGAGGGSSSGDPGMSRPFAFAFVKFTQHSASEAAIRALNGKQFIAGATGPVRVAYAESNQPVQGHSQSHSHRHTHVHAQKTVSSTAIAAPLPYPMHGPPFASMHPVHTPTPPSMYLPTAPPLHYSYYPPPPPPPHGQFMPGTMMPAVAAMPPEPPMHHPHHQHRHPQFVPHPPPTLPEPRLHIGSLPSSVTREQLVDIFSLYGHVMECHIMRPKGGSSSGCSAFVRFATREQADITVKAVNGCLFPGTGRHMVVKYASATSLFPEDSISTEHPGSKLFVGGVPPAATEDDLISVFSLFGTVTDVHVMRHSDGSSKGSAFVKYASRDMAERALMSVNGIVTMQGGRRTLHVKFAGRSSSSGSLRSIPASPAGDMSPQHSPAMYTPSPSPSPMPSIPTPPASPLDSPVSITPSTMTALMDDPQRGQKHSIERETDELELPTKLFVGGIPYSMTEPDLARFFSMYGVPRDVFILKNENLQSKGCAFVRMSTQAESERAIRAIDRVVTLPGASKTLRVQFADNDDFSAKRQRR